MRAALFAMLLMSCTPVPAATMDSEGRIVLTADEQQRCADGGGCHLISAKELDALIRLALAGKFCNKNTAFRNS